MRSFAKTLKESYIILISLFTLTLLLSMLVIGKYLINSSKQNLRDGMAFLEYEISKEPLDKNMEIFTKNLVTEDFRKENPLLTNLGINIEYKDNKYIEVNNSKIEKKAELDKVKNINLYDTLFLKNNIDLKSGERFDVILIKNTKSEKKFFFDLVKITSVGLLILILISIFVVRYFLKKTLKELKSLENINRNITLENLEIKKPINQFEEFKNIWDSYENMLLRLDEQNKKQVEFVHNASHELKTPIFIIGGYVDMMKRWGKKDEKILDESIESIAGEVKEMTDLIEKLFFIAKDSEIKINKDDIEISEIIIDIISKLKMKYPSAQVNFAPEYVILSSDEGLVRLIIRNVLENAIKYGNSNPVDISLEYNDNEVYICIQDHGLGMNEESIKHIYDRFYRANKSRNKKIKGHGLGMTIVSRAIKLLDGDISIKSQLDVGTKVKIILKK